MKDINKSIIKRANEAVSRGDYEAFLAYCTEDTVWEFVGDQTLRGKPAVRDYIAKTYINPPQFDVHMYIEEGDMLTAVGRITLPDETGTSITYDYCDVWTLRDGKLHELKAFVVAV